ncbi:MAG: amidohydrolase [Fimbriimonadales bacterium]
MSSNHGVTLFHNLKYFDGSGFRRGEIAVEAGRIRAVGEGLPRSGAVLEDLDGEFVCPAFNDCHCHVSMLAESFGFVDVSAVRCPTIPSVLDAMKEHARCLPSGRWVTGHGYLASAVVENRYPTLAEMDAAVPDRPAIIWHASRHGMIANSLALRAGGIGADSEDPPGGKIGRDLQGRLNGLLFEDAVALVRRVQPKMGKTELADNLVLAARHLNRMGITAATDATSFRFGLEEELWAYRAAAERGMSLRIRLTPLYDFLAARGEVPTRDEWDPLRGHPTVAIGGVKLFADGAIGTRTAAITGEFLSGGSGLLIHPQEELEQAVWDIHRAGRQVIVHAIGDRAIASCLTAIEKALTRQPRADHRHRIEHSMLLTPDLIRRYVGAGVCATMQPEFLLRFADDYLQALGERAKGVKPMRSLLNAGVPIGFSSDLTIVPGDPADGMLAAVHRRSAKGTQLDLSEALSPAEALRCYTEGSAYVGFQEAELGNIAPGMLADFVLYDSDPLSNLSNGSTPKPMGAMFAGTRLRF